MGFKTPHVRVLISVGATHAFQKFTAGEDSKHATEYRWTRCRYRVSYTLHERRTCPPVTSSRALV
jgi:hypothetical protein